MKDLFLFGLIFLGGCLAKPEQPSLTEQEERFIASLREACGCEVKREIDVMLLKQFAKTHKRGGYALIFNLKCDDLKWLNERTDSARKRADSLVVPLYNVLGRDFKFNEITISFTCSTNLANSSYYRDIFYTYKTDSLN